MDFTGRPMKGFVYIVPSGYESDGDLKRWVDLGVGYVASLPAKAPGESGSPKKRTKRTSAKEQGRRGDR